MKKTTDEVAEERLIRLFEKNGPHGLSPREIQKACGVVYHQYPLYQLRKRGFKIQCHWGHRWETWYTLERKGRS